MSQSPKKSTNKRIREDDQQIDQIDQDIYQFLGRPNDDPTTLRFDSVVRNMSNPYDDDDAMPLDYQEERINEHVENLRDNNVVPTNKFMRRNEIGQDATNHGFSSSTQRDVEYGTDGRIIDNDPHRLWTEPGSKAKAKDNLEQSKKLLEIAEPVYNKIITDISQGNASRDQPYVIQKLNVKTKGDFIDMYENLKLSIPPDRPSRGGKKSKKNRTTKRKSKRKNKRKTLNKKSKRKTSKKKSKP